MSKMGGDHHPRRICCKCTARTFLLTICTLQLVSSIERQVFDFLGQMWLAILFNFFSTIFTMIGLFGVYYRRAGHLTLFLLWQVVSISWNAFVIGIYLQIPPLHQETSSDMLNLGTGSRSWWESNGPYCEPQYNVTSSVISYYEFRPISVQGCLLPFYAIETAQAAVHLLLTLFALVVSFYLLITFCTRQDDSSTLRPGISGNVGPSLPSHYSISMSYHPRPSSAMDARDGRHRMSTRDASHRRSAHSLNSRRSLKRSRNGRGSTRSTASQRRRKRMQRANHHPNGPQPYEDPYDTYGGSSVYQSQNQLISSHYDGSSLDSFNPNGHANPLYGGSLHSTGSRFSLYTLNPHASTVENINVNSSSASHQNLSNNHPHHNQNNHYQPNNYGYTTTNGTYRDYRPADQPATIGRRGRRPRSPIYMNSETSM